MLPADAVPESVVVVEDVRTPASVERAAAVDGWVGANFWSRTGGPHMWSRYDGGDRPRGARRARGARAQRHALVPLLARLRAASRTELDEDVVARFADFLDGARREPGCAPIPTFIVGHMSGENWDPAWRDGRDLYGDVGLVAEQAWLAAEIARRFGSPPGRRRLADLERDAAVRRPRPRRRRRRVGTHPRACGARRRGDAARLARRRRLGHRGDRRGQRLLAARRWRRSSTSSARTVYPMDDDPVRQALTPALGVRARRRLRTARRARGVRRQLRLRVATRTPPATTARCSTRRCSPARTGWLAWNNTDFDDVADHDPYRHHVFELHFGLTDRDGRPKQQLRELGDVRRRSSRDLAADGWARVDGDAGARRAGALRARPPLHRRRGPPRHPRRPAAGVRRRARGRPAGRAPARARRHRRRAAARTSRRARSC